MYLLLTYIFIRVKLNKLNISIILLIFGLLTVLYLIIFKIILLIALIVVLFACIFRLICMLGEYLFISFLYEKFLIFRIMLDVVNHIVINWILNIIFTMNILTIFIQTLLFFSICLGTHCLNFFKESFKLLMNFLPTTNSIELFLELFEHFCDMITFSTILN